MLPIAWDLDLADHPLGKMPDAAVGPLVSVVIPAFNAAATLDQTLQSVRAQTHRCLDIIVVDDGSTDATAEIALSHASADPRIRLVRQANGGVAAARNAGVRLARGELVAPIDADDLWAPTKIERQVAALAANPEAMLAYTWYACVNERGRIVGYGGRHGGEQDTLRAMCRTNLVGNGSGALMRKQAMLALGCYDESLRARGGQGCEDYKLYLGLAAMGPVVAVQDFLTGYRVSPHNMSSDTVQMCRSHLMVLEEFAAAHRELTADLRVGRHGFARWLVLRALRELRFIRLIGLFVTLMKHDGWAALHLLVTAPAFLIRRFGRKVRSLFPTGERPVDTTKVFPAGGVEV